MHHSKDMERKTSVNKMTFNQFFLSKIDELDGVEKSDTLRDKCQTLAILNEFKPELGFGDINPVTMYDFMNYLKREGYAESTRYKHKKNVTWAINRAINARAIDPLTKPWGAMEIKRPEGSRTYSERHVIHRNR